MKRVDLERQAYMNDLLKEMFALQEEIESQKENDQNCKVGSMKESKDASIKDAKYRLGKVAIKLEELNL